MSGKQNGSIDDNVYIIRKLLEQIHNYFEYLDCPFYNSDMSERDLLLMLIQPSERRYQLLEWMINRLEPDIDFFLPNDFGSGEYIHESTIQKESINAISYLKNLGLCYSRVLVPDIVHAKVGPLIQLKFLVRLLRGIRLKSWNRKPVIKSKCSPYRNTLNDQDLMEDKLDIDCEDTVSNFEAKSSNKDILKFIHELIEKNPSAKIILDILENRLDSEQMLIIKEKLFISLIRKLTSKSNSKTKCNIKSSISLITSNISFLDGIIHLIIEEVIRPESVEERSILRSPNSYDSYCSLTVKNVITNSRSASKCSGDIMEKSKDILKQNYSKYANDERLLQEASKLYTTSVNVQKQLACYGDDILQPRSHNSQNKRFYEPSAKLGEKNN